MKVETKDDFILWLANGARGVSSNTIATVLSGIDCLAGHRMSHPLDKSDFYRCDMLIQQVPEFKERLDEMAKISQYWAALVKDWDYSRMHIHEVLNSAHTCIVCGAYLGSSWKSDINDRGFCIEKNCIEKFSGE